MNETRFHPDIVIIGAGFGGLAVGRQLRLHGYTNFVIAERAQDVGGVWRENHYPNAACDVPVELYSFTFQQSSDWTCNFASSQEILNYARRVARDQGIIDHIRFDTAVKSAVWSADEESWVVKTSRDDSWTPRFVIWAGGRLHRPKMPAIPGMDDFGGEIFHTARWRHDIEISNRNVALVGAGASSLQVLPFLAERSRRLFAFVRTPSYVMPRPETYYSDEDRQNFRENPAAAVNLRKKWYDVFENGARLRFPMNENLLVKAEADWRDFFHREIEDPKMRRLLTPKYRFGCRRPGFSNLYYRWIRERSVTVIPSGLLRMTPEGGVAEDGESYKFDIAVMATGFEAELAQGDLTIVGCDSTTLNDQWLQGPECYLGTVVKNFPNFFFMDGPNAGVASIMDVFEAQSRYIASCLDLLKLCGASCLQVKASVQDAFNVMINNRAEASVLVRGSCSSFYRVGGTGRVFTHWPGLPSELEALLRIPEPSDFSFSGEHT